MEMGIVRNIPDHRGYFIWYYTVTSFCFNGHVQGMNSAEIFFCSRGCNNNGIRLFQCSFRISLYRRQGKHIKESRINMCSTGFINIIITFFQEFITVIKYAGIVLYLRVIFFQQLSHHITRKGQVKICSEMYVGIYAINAICIRIISVIIQFVNYVERYKKKAGKSDRQANYVDEGKNLILYQISPCRFEIIFKHSDKSKFRSLKKRSSPFLQFLFLTPHSVLKLFTGFA